MMPTDTYARLAAPFLHPDGTPATRSRSGTGGMMLSYLDGEQVISRLNEVLGFDGWSYRILQHGINSDADEAWCLARLTITMPDPDAEIGSKIIIREGFGSQKLRRDRAGVIADLGFDLKGASTDALKKCATLIGIGLYLYEKDGPASGSAPGGSSAGASAPPAQVDTHCAQCSKIIGSTTFRDGTVWDSVKTADQSRKKFGRPLCMECYRAENDKWRREHPEEAARAAQRNGAGARS